MTDRQGQNPDPKHDHLKKTFQKGNINFDFLQPEIQKDLGGKEGINGEKSSDSSSTLNERIKVNENKRGLFFKNRHPKPVTITQILVWISLLLISVCLFLWSFIFAKSFIWLLILPIIMLTGLWSIIMLILILARPR